MTNPNGTADQIAQQVFDGISVYQNSSGQTPCFSVTSEATGALDADSGWEYQTCTEMVMPMCNNGTDMFDPSPWDFPAWSDYCFQTYQVRPRLDWATTVYGGTNIGAASNIIFRYFAIFGIWKRIWALLKLLEPPHPFNE